MKFPAPWSEPNVMTKSANHGNAIAVPFVHGRLKLAMQPGGQILHGLTCNLKSYSLRPKGVVV